MEGAGNRGPSWHHGLGHGASVQLLKIESENIRAPHPDRERGVHPHLHRPHAAPVSHHPPCSPATLSPTRQCLSPRSGWIPLGSLGELLQWLTQILHKRKNSRQVALPNLVIPSPAVLTAPSAAISSPRSPPCSGGGTGRSGSASANAPCRKHPAPATMRRAWPRAASGLAGLGGMLLWSHMRSRGKMHTLGPGLGKAESSAPTAVGQAPQSHFLKRIWSRGTEV